MTPPLDVLLVEDDPADAELTKLGFDRAGVAARIRTARDVRAAFEALRAGPLPEVVLLDLNLDASDGAEVLSGIRTDPVLSKLPVAVLTTSDAPRDRDRCARLGADLYLVKPPLLAGWMDVAHQVEALARRPT